MARYIDMDGYRKLFDEEYKKTRKLISEGETHLDNLAEGFSEASRVIDRMPTEDVVPKSEVEELEKEVERLTAILHSYALQYGTVADKQKAIDKAKAKVAREIFEEIEKLSHKFMNDQHYIFGDMLWDIYELKKKYTEEKK